MTLLLAALLVSTPMAQEPDAVVVGRPFTPVQVDYWMERGRIRLCGARNKAQPATRVSEACEAVRQCADEGARYRAAIAVCVDRKLFAKWKAESPG